MELSIDPTGAVAPYEQLKRQLSDLIVAERMKSGDRLPSVRQLARDLGLAPGTVARAYRELEQEGMLVTRRGGGTQVAERASDQNDRMKLLDSLTADFVQRARDLNFTDAEVAAAIANASTGQA